MIISGKLIVEDKDRKRIPPNIAGAVMTRHEVKEHRYGRECQKIEDNKTDWDREQEDYQAHLDYVQNVKRDTRKQKTNSKIIRKPAVKKKAKR